VGLKSRATEGPSLKAGQVWYDPIIDRLVLLDDNHTHGFYMIYFYGNKKDHWCYLLSVYLDRLIYIGDL